MVLSQKLTNLQEEHDLLNDFTTIFEQMKLLNRTRGAAVEALAAWHQDEAQKLKQAHAAELAEVRREHEKEIAKMAKEREVSFMMVSCGVCSS